MTHSIQASSLHTSQKNSPTKLPQDRDNRELSKEKTCSTLCLGCLSFLWSCLSSQEIAPLQRRNSKEDLLATSTSKLNSTTQSVAKKAMRPIEQQTRRCPSPPTYTFSTYTFPGAPFHGYNSMYYC